MRMVSDEPEKKMSDSFVFFVPFVVNRMGWMGILWILSIMSESIFG